MVRPPAVAGRFYSDQPKRTRGTSAVVLCRSYRLARGAKLSPAWFPMRAIDFPDMSPGPCMRELDLPRHFLLLGPRHYPRGEAQAILSEGSWQTPLGRAEIDTELAAELKRACAALTEDEVAHRDEHALEVQLPFLQVLAGDFRFVPIALGTRDYAALESLGKASRTSSRSQPSRC